MSKIYYYVEIEGRHKNYSKYQIVSVILAENDRPRYPIRLTL